MATVRTRFGFGSLHDVQTSRDKPSERHNVATIKPLAEYKYEVGNGLDLPPVGYLEAVSAAELFAAMPGVQEAAHRYGVAGRGTCSF